ncbi:MAG TPA: hypothetical protein VHL80_11355, partial [Polyangia bacterium]|nr:hypothetical protein [Polyangia bacterium]
APAAAQLPPAPPPAEATPPAPAPPAADEVVDSDAEAALVEEQIRQNEQLAASRRQRIQVGGYVDFGWFATEGNGSGVVEDVMHSYPGFGGYQWVFPGDLLAPAINSRGDVADLGDLPGVVRDDAIHSQGAPGFIVNEVNLRLRATPTPNAIITTSVNFLPRTGSNFSLGDLFEVDLAQLEWLPGASQRTSIFVGKIDSVLGIEYRQRKADQRFGITPSLIARYTTGTALGLKVRSKLGADDWLTIAAAVTNGSNTIEPFFFYNETDTNAAPTGSARLSVRLPLPVSLELGVSGSYGPQDRSTNVGQAMWFFGPDLILRAGPVDVLVQWLEGRSPGDPTEDVYALALHGGGYVETHVMATGTLGLLGRIEYRSADITLPPERAYPSRTWRGTLGVRVVMDTWAVLKAEYLHNGEYGDLPTVSDDVLTTSLVLSY